MDLRSGRIKEGILVKEMQIKEVGLLERKGSVATRKTLTEVSMGRLSEGRKGLLKERSVGECE